MRRAWPLALVPLLTMASQAAAVSFSDVPTTSLYYDAIMSLADKGVIGGNPDGTFREKNPINRAAALKMLYVAAGKSGDATDKNCFANEKFDDWFAPYACHAVKMGWVSGYGNGRFGAADPVTFAQLAKMALNVFGIPVSPTADLSVLAYYPNVSASDWSAPYIATAVSVGILPLPGLDPLQFYPNDVSSRGQAASFVHKAWTAWKNGGWMTTSSSSSVAETSSASSAASSAASTGRRSSKGGATKPPAEIKKVAFPFEDNWTFSGKNAVTYAFSLKGASVADIRVNLAAGMQGDVSCRLYRIQPDGFSLEYYLGYQETGNCALLTALTAGDYQLQLQPTQSGVTYSVSAALGKGDGNDGLSQAKSVQPGLIKVDYLDPNDLEDWFKFTVSGAPELGTPMTFQATSTTHVTCLIYPWSDVDIYGFEGPKCNEEYSYPNGTYYVRIGHGAQKALRQTYSLELR